MAVQKRIAYKFDAQIDDILMAGQRHSDTERITFRSLVDFYDATALCCYYMH